MNANQYRPGVRTVLGHADGADYAIRDKMLYRDFRGHTSFWQLIAFSVGGVELSAADAELLDALVVCAYVSEPRVWPIKMSRLMAAQGHAATGFGASVLVMDSEILGVRIATRAATMLRDLQVQMADAPPAQSESILEAHFAGLPRVPGFGVPARSEDERVAAFRLCLAEREGARRTYLQLTARAASYLKRTRNLESNIALWIAATCMDVGFAVADAGTLATLLLGMPMLANAHEAAEQQSPLMRELPSAAVRYAGPPARSSPRRLADGLAGTR